MKTLAYIFMSLSALAMVGCRGKGDALKEGKMEYAPEVNTVEVMTLTRKAFCRFAGGAEIRYDRRNQDNEHKERAACQCLPDHS